MMNTNGQNRIKTTVGNYLTLDSVGKNIIGNVILSTLTPEATTSGYITGTISSYLATTEDGNGIISTIISDYLVTDAGKQLVNSIISTTLAPEAVTSSYITGTISSFVKATQLWNEEQPSQSQQDTDQGDDDNG